jgi:MFS superfamily sulfate permease-like transporter
VHAWHASRWEFSVFFTTMLLVVVEDLLIGVGVGLALTAGRLLIQLSQLHIRVKQREGLTVVRLRGAATFVSLPRLAEALDGLPTTGEVHIDTTALSFVDHTCVHHLQAWAAQARARDQRVLLDETYLLLIQNPTLAAVDPNGSSPSLS